MISPHEGLAPAFSILPTFIAEALSRQERWGIGHSSNAIDSSSSYQDLLDFIE